VPLPSSPPPAGEGMKAAQLPSFAGSGCVAGFTSFAPTSLRREEVAAPNLMALASTRNEFVASECWLFSQPGFPLA